MNTNSVHVFAHDDASYVCAANALKNGRTLDHDGPIPCPACGETLVVRIDSKTRYENPYIRCKGFKKGCTYGGRPLGLYDEELTHPKRDAIVQYLLENPSVRKHSVNKHGNTNFNHSIVL